MNKYSGKIENAISNKRIFHGFEQSVNLPEIHIAFGVSKNFVPPMGVLITSLLEKNKDIRFSIHVFSDELEKEDMERLELFAKTYQITIILYFIQNELFLDLNKAQFTVAAYYRFLIPKALENITNRFLYLDADMICVSKLNSLLELDFDGKIACVVEDHKVTKEDSPHLSLSGNQYFNSGMLYIDIIKWNDAKISEQCLELLDRRSYEFACFDQDALNIILENQVKYISSKWNYLCNTGNRDLANIVQVPEDTVIIHYIGFNKPWHRWCYHPLANYFRNVLQESLWKETPLIEVPKKYREMKMMAAFCCHEKNYLKSIYWGIQAGIKKIKDRLN
jgi:lipopolysaccharide biosynthesis glycosyltransferase